MKVTISIDDPLFKGDFENRFQDFLGRVVADIAGNISDDDCMKLCGRYEFEIAVLLRTAFKKGEYTDE